MFGGANENVTPKKRKVCGSTINLLPKGISPIKQIFCTVAEKQRMRGVKRKMEWYGERGNWKLFSSKRIIVNHTKSVVCLIVLSII